MSFSDGTNRCRVTVVRNNEQNQKSHEIRHFTSMVSLAFDCLYLHINVYPALQEC